MREEGQGQVGSPWRWGEAVADSSLQRHGGADLTLTMTPYIDRFFVFMFLCFSHLEIQKHSTEMRDENVSTNAFNRYYNPHANRWW